ncbi:MAG: hypothetical protein HW421_1789 [Ignavibacteria bacterium]|nr:hypothetical protein [Ignavibacteria bacterium]
MPVSNLIKRIALTLEDFKIPYFASAVFTFAALREKNFSRKAAK